MFCQGHWAVFPCVHKLNIVPPLRESSLLFSPLFNIYLNKLKSVHLKQNTMQVVVNNKTLISINRSDAEVFLYFEVTIVLFKNLDVSSKF